MRLIEFLHVDLQCTEQKSPYVNARERYRKA